MIFVAKSAQDGQIEYRDTKRYLWVLSVLSPLAPGLCAIMLAQTGQLFWSGAALLFYFVFIPVADMLIGDDKTNPPEEIVEQLSADNYYRVLLFMGVLTQVAGFFTVFYVIGTVEMPIWAVLLLTISSATAAGSGLTIGHELGHKQNRLDQWGAKLVNALTGYGHFCIEHNRGHHTMVATPEDHASAKLGESVWAFALREIPHVLVHGWRLERQRLEKRGYGFWTWRNDILQGYAITIAFAAVLIGAFGWWMLPLLILHHLKGWFMLTLANYVEHYGLKRDKKANGRYEPCQPYHSWNTNHIVSNLMLFHLQRHSDHHANPMRPYQALRNFPELPTLPSGYAGTFALAICPPVWRAIMDRKVYDWAAGNVEKCNVAPGKEAYYQAKFARWSQA